MARRAWLTRDTVPDSTTVTFSLPNDAKWQADFFGALVELTKAHNWQESGTLTPEQMADEWLKYFDDWTTP